MSDVRQRNTLGNRFRFLVRVLGLTGLVAAVVGAVLLTTVPTDLPGWADAASRSPVEWATDAGTWASSAGQWLWNTATGAADRFTQVSAAVLLGGLAAV